METSAKNFLLNSFDNIINQYHIPTENPPQKTTPLSSNSNPGGITRAYGLTSDGSDAGSGAGAVGAVVAAGVVVAAGAVATGTVGIAGAAGIAGGAAALCAAASFAGNILSHNNSTKENAATKRLAKKKADEGVFFAASALVRNSNSDNESTKENTSTKRLPQKKAKPTPDDIPNDLLVDSKTLFYKTICEICDAKNITESQLYNKACISRAVFSKIRGMGKNSDYIPKKNTVMQLCIALELSFSDAQNLMALVGYTLSDTIPVDKIVSFCLEHTEFAWEVSTLNDVIYEKTGESPFIKAA